MIRRACALMGLFAVLLQGSNGGHMLLVEHTRCAEHGDLVHGGESHGHAGASHAESDLVALEGVSDEPSEAAHEHCSLTAEPRDAEVLVSEAQVASRISDATAIEVAPDRFVSVEAARFRLAPKNSPPA